MWCLGVAEVLKDGVAAVDAGAAVWSLLVSNILPIANTCAMIYLFGWKLGRLELKVDTLWDFQLRRGLNEGRNKGTIVVNSPWTMTPETRQAFEEFLPELRAFRAKFGDFQSAGDLAFEISRQFGRRLSETVVPRLGIHEGLGMAILIKLLEEMKEPKETPK